MTWLAKHLPYQGLKITKSFAGIAAKNEERSLAKLKRKKQYARSEIPHQPVDAQMANKEIKKEKTKSHKQVRCYNCNGLGHFTSQCRVPTSESQGKPKTGGAYGTKVIWSQADPRIKKPEDYSFSEVLTFHKHLKSHNV